MLNNLKYGLDIIYTWLCRLRRKWHGIELGEDIDLTGIPELITEVLKKTQERKVLIHPQKIRG